MDIKPITMWSFFNTAQDTRLTGLLMSGNSVITTEISLIRGRFVQTRNSIYYLEEVDPTYLAILDLPKDCDDIKIIVAAITNPKFEIL